MNDEATAPKTLWPGNMEEVLVRQAVQTPVERETTLAFFVELLGPGSACFCCGHPLRASRHSASDGRDSGDSDALTCLRCGAGVFGADTAVQTRGIERGMASLAAA